MGTLADDTLYFVLASLQSAFSGSKSVKLSTRCTVGIKSTALSSLFRMSSCENQFKTASQRFANSAQGTRFDSRAGYIVSSIANGSSSLRCFFGAV